MSVSKWRYSEACEGKPCIGDCDLCSGYEDDDDNEIEQDGRITQEDPDDSKGISEAI